ncbi:MAG: hypothetical protein ACI9V8_000726 [Urechidicola sp.]|jgi:hypothetical protein
MERSGVPVYACFAGTKTVIVFIRMSINTAQVIATYTEENNKVVGCVFNSDKFFLGRVIVISFND